MIPKDGPVRGARGTLPQADDALDVGGERIILFPPAAVATRKAWSRRAGTRTYSPARCGRITSPTHISPASGRGSRRRQRARRPSYSATRHTFGGMSAGRGESLRVARRGDGPRGREHDAPLRARGFHPRQAGDCCSTRPGDLALNVSISALSASW